MKSQESFPNQKENAPSVLWIKKDDKMSPLALQEFGNYLMGRPEYRKGDMALHRVRLEDPLEIIFFGDSPDRKDDHIFHIVQDYKVGGFRISVVQGDKEKIYALLREFGLIPSWGSR